MLEQVVETRAVAVDDGESSLLWRLLSTGSGLLVLLALAGFVAYDSLLATDARPVRSTAAVATGSGFANRAAVNISVPSNRAVVYLVCVAARATDLNFAIAKSGISGVVLHDGDPSSTEGRHVLAEMQARGIVANMIYDDCLNPAPVATLLGLSGQ